MVVYVAINELVLFLGWFACLQGTSINDSNIFFLKVLLNIHTYMYLLIYLAKQYNIFLKSENYEDLHCLFLFWLNNLLMTMLSILIYTQA